MRRHTIALRAVAAGILLVLAGCDSKSPIQTDPAGQPQSPEAQTNAVAQTVATAQQAASAPPAK